MKMRTVQVLKNRKSANEHLTNAVTYNEIIPRIKGDVTISGYFQATIDKAVEIKASGGSCETCDLNKNKDLLLSFISDFKKCPAGKRAVVSNILSEKQWVSHSGKWINIVSNTIEDHEFEPGQIPIAAARKKANMVAPPSKKKAVGEKLPLLKKEAQHPASPKKIEVAPIVKKKEEHQVTIGKKKFIFTNFQAPGDIVTMTAAIRDLHINFPGKFITDIRTNSMPIWESNEYITPLDEKDPDVTVMPLKYDLIHQSNQGPFHFTEGFTEHLEEVLGVRIKKRIGRGHIKIGSDEEGWGKSERESWFGDHGYSSETQYWIVNSGHKSDFTCKMWPEDRYQKIVDHYQGKILFVQIGHKDHTHPNLEGAINLVGKTDDRQLIRLVWASSGVITPCSYPMTLAAAVPVRPGACNGRRNRPCVVIAGGREPAGWQAHTEHQFIHTCGMLPCCDQGGCWTSRVKPIGDGDEKDKKNMCRHVVTADNGIELPYCMDMITPEEVIRRIDMYYSFYEAGRKKTISYNQRGDR